MTRGEFSQPWASRSRLGCALLFVLLALGYTFATGPFRAPDEPSHFFRAYAISEGHFVAERRRSDLLGSSLPRNIPKLATILAGYPKDPPIHVQRGQMEVARRLPLKRSARTFVHFPGAAMHSPLAYLPAALAIFTGRLLGLSPLLIFYLARCANAVLVAAALGWGLSRIWQRAPFLASVALFPMTLSQVGCVTADAVTFGVTFCWLAEILHCSSTSDEALRSHWRWLFSALVLSQLRFPYPLLGLLVFKLPAEVIASTPAGRRRFLALFFLLLIAPCLSWIMIVRNLQVQMRPFVQVDALAQLSYVFHHPDSFVWVLFSTLRTLGSIYWHEAVGVLGWLDFPVPSWILCGLTLCLLVTVSSSDSHGLRLTPRFRVACFLLGAGGLLLTMLLVYLAWNKVGATAIEGWQGRYSLPLLPLILLAVANRLGRRVRWLSPAALAFSLLANVVVIFLLARATYGVA